VFFFNFLAKRTKSASEFSIGLAMKITNLYFKFLFNLCFKANIAIAIEFFKLIFPFTTIDDKLALIISLSCVRVFKTLTDYPAIVMRPTSFSGLDTNFPLANDKQASYWAICLVGIKSPFLEWLELSINIIVASRDIFKFINIINNLHQNETTILLGANIKQSTHIATIR